MRRIHGFCFTGETKYDSLLRYIVDANDGNRPISCGLLLTSGSSMRFMRDYTTARSLSCIDRVHDWTSLDGSGSVTTSAQTQQSVSVWSGHRCFAENSWIFNELNGHGVA